MIFEIKKREDLNATLANILIQEYRLNKLEVPPLLNLLDDFLKDCRDDLFICIEFPYVDKLFRNTYYNYWSGKHKHYHRDCIRLSFFCCDLSLTDFYDRDKIKILQKNFLGFLVLRPVRKIIGRNILRPDFYKKQVDFYTAVTPGEASVNGIKFEIEGFPHCSQDSEMIVCAETALWSLMEYFAYRYHDHKPVLPRTIHKILSKNVAFRQIPSGGLSGGEIAYVLKKVGFGVQFYTPSVYTDPEFFNILKIYIESCIPVMAIISNSAGTVHVMNIVGRTENKTSLMFSVMDTMPSGSVLYNFYEQSAEYLVIDDNLKPYSQIDFIDPAKNYIDSPNFAGCKINATIVPLYPRIYTEPQKAQGFIVEHLKQLDEILGLDSYVLRVLLSSSRSYKNYVALNSDLPENVKTAILSTHMPKFIWIGELSTVDQAKKPDKEKKACGLVIIDATEPKNREVILTMVKDLYIGVLNNQYGVYSLSLPPFLIFNNLKPY